MNNKTYKREFTSPAFEAENDVKRVRVKIVQMQRNLESGADAIGRFKVKDMVRVWWAQGWQNTSTLSNNTSIY